MDSGRKLREYSRSTSTFYPDIESFSIKLTREITLALDVPSFGVAESSCKMGESKSSLLQVASAHAAFKSAIQPDIDPGDSSCIAEVNAISLCFPDIESKALRIVFTAWLAFACVMDDTLEMMPVQKREASLLECVEIVRSALNHVPAQLVSVTTLSQERRIQEMTHVLYNHCVRHLSQASAHAIFAAVCTVLEAHVDEIRFLQGRVANDLPTYMAIRSRTIALNPFFQVIKSEFLAEAERDCDSTWERLQLEVCRVAGLQNDLIGLVRDLKDGEELNAVIVLMRSYGFSNKSEPNPAMLSWCIAQISTQHNQGVARCLYYASRLHPAAGDSRPDTKVAARHILLLCETHLKWCASAKRYGLESCISQTHNIGLDFPSLPITWNSSASAAMRSSVRGTPCVRISEGGVSATGDSTTEM